MLSYPEKGVPKHHHRRHPSFLKAAREAEGMPQDEAPTNHPGLQDMEDNAPPAADQSRVSGLMGEDDGDPEQRADGGAVQDEPIEPLQQQEPLQQNQSWLQRMRNDEGGRGLSDWRPSFGENEGSAVPTERKIRERRGSGNEEG